MFSREKDPMEEEEGKQEDHQGRNINLTTNNNNNPAPRRSTTTTTTTTGGASSSSSRSTSSQWSAFRNPRIVRVSRTFGGKDRHSKVCTVRGLRDRRIRLSVPTAIQLYDLQDRLGVGQPSKVIDWLIENTTEDIDKLPPLQLPHSFGIEAAAGGSYDHYNSSLLQMAPFFDFGRSAAGTSTATGTGTGATGTGTGTSTNNNVGDLNSYQWGDHNHHHHHHQLPILGLGNNYGHDDHHHHHAFLPSSYLALSSNNTSTSPHDHQPLMPPPPHPHPAPYPPYNQIEMMNNDDNHHQHHYHQRHQQLFSGLLSSSSVRPAQQFPFNFVNQGHERDDGGGSSGGS